MKNWVGSGYQMVWGVPMLPAIPQVSLADGASGAYTNHFIVLAKHLVSANMGNAILRLGWEFNQKSYPWYAAGQSAHFTEYWRRIVEAMRSVPGSHFKFMWNPDRGDQGNGDVAMGNFTAYYPGNQYVDIIGLDVYDSAWKLYPGAPGEFYTVLTQPWGLDWLANFGRVMKKPIAIPELGLGLGNSAPNSGSVVGAGMVGGGDDPVFLADVVAWIASHRVVETGFWDVGGSAIFSGRNPKSEASLKNYFANA